MRASLCAWRDALRAQISHICNATHPAAARDERGAAVPILRLWFRADHGTFRRGTDCAGRAGLAGVRRVPCINPIEWAFGRSAVKLKDLAAPVVALGVGVAIHSSVVRGESPASAPGASQPSAAATQPEKDKDLVAVKRATLRASIDLDGYF